jgi:hypothetical protein
LIVEQLIPHIQEVVCRIPHDVIPPNEIPPLVFLAKFLEAKGDLDLLARHKHEEFDYVTMREITLLRLSDREGELWVRGDYLYPSWLHFWMLCYGFTKDLKELTLWMYG